MKSVISILFLSLVISFFSFAQIPTDGLVAWYPFNGNANDESGNGNDGFIFDATLTTDRSDNINQAYSFDGSNDYIQLPASITITQDLTISFWIKTTQASSGEWGASIFLICRDKVTTTRDWSIALGNGGKIQFNTGTLSVEQTLKSITDINDGYWKHIVVQRNSSGNLKNIFINGILSNSEIFDDFAFTNGEESIFIGTTLSIRNHYAGIMDDIRIYNRALTNEEIQALYYEGATPPCQGVTTVNYGSQIYNTVNIGNQCWLKENLNIGTMILGNQNPSQENPDIEKYCYNNDPTNCDIYGGLYQWNEAMQYVTTEGAQGICPPGWHIPTNTEFETLISYVGTNGNDLKAIGQGSDNGVGTNTSGFSALLAGDRIDGNYYTINEYTAFWSSTDDSPNHHLSLYYDNNNVWVDHDYYDYGFSIRCIKGGNNIGKEFFDDFRYQNSGDPKLITNGWRIVNDKNSGPPPGANYSKNNISFVPNDEYSGDKIVVLKSDVKDNATTNARLETSQMKFKYGTYAARVKFDENIISNSDVNVQAFYTINDEKYSWDYSELDFEFLPHGTWGPPSGMPRLHTTSWAWYSDEQRNFNCSYSEEVSQEWLQNWHILRIDVSDNVNVKYYIDDLLFKEHEQNCNSFLWNFYSRSVYPDERMGIAISNWIEIWESIMLDRDYTLMVDWIYYGQDVSLSRAQIENRVNEVRIEGYTDNITTPPLITSNSYICVRATCPVILEAYDQYGNHTGPTSETSWEEQIPGSIYVGGDLNDPNSTKVIVFDEVDFILLKVTSQNTNASFDLKLDEYRNGYNLKSVLFDSVIMQESSIATCSLRTISPLIFLNMDYDGDDDVDTILYPTNYSVLSTTVYVNDNWNMISLPVEVDDNRKDFLFPSSISDAFKYESEYISEDSLENGIGYWMKFPSTENIQIAGIPLHRDSISVHDGWNLIGSISDTIPVSSINSNPSGIVTSEFFNYGGSYNVSDSIIPGKGYWVKVDQVGQLILSAESGGSLKNRIKIVPTSELPPPPPGDNGEMNTLPTVYALDQAYPNPFNPTTTIRYQLPGNSKVSLKVYNTLGQLVISLADKVEEAGFKSIEWNASSVASGVYFYRLEATSVTDPSKTFTQVKKMLLVK